MAAAEDSGRRAPRNQLMLLGGVFAVVLAVLAAGYFLFLRTDYVVLAEGLRPADASAIVAELDKGGKPYRLSDGGSTILVPGTEADATRVAIAGSDAAARGQIGFELFNKSDMGLTNFAQKINYQRALQGELVRTITMMDGVESARVHLALPERALFRGDRQEPRAAVTVAMKPGQTADPSRVAGIQRLVAAAVPELSEGKVAVLDAAGRVISPSAAPMAEGEVPADLEERVAVENYYRARARGAVERRLPGIRFALRVLALPVEGTYAPSAGEPASAGWTSAEEGGSRNFRLRMAFVTEASLGSEDRAMVREAVTQAVALNETAGDSLLFETGSVDPVAPSPERIAAPKQQPAPVALPLPAPDAGWIAALPWALGGLLLAGLAGFLVFGRRRGPALGSEDHEAFAARLRRQLNLEGGDAAA